MAGAIGLSRMVWCKGTSDDINGHSLRTPCRATGSRFKIKDIDIRRGWPPWFVNGSALGALDEELAIAADHFMDKGPELPTCAICSLFPIFANTDIRNMYFIMRIAIAVWNLRIITWDTFVIRPMALRVATISSSLLG